MKLHRNLVAAVADALQAVLIEGKQADTLLERMFHANKNWGARDRNFIASNTYYIIRYKRLLAYCAGLEPTDRLGFWRLFAVKQVLEGHPLPQLPETEVLATEDILKRYEEAKHIRKIAESIPDWLDELGEQELGEAWGAEIHALNGTAAVGLRINTLKAAPANVKAELQRDGITFDEVPGMPEAMVLKERKNFRAHFAYKSGWFEIQDISSQHVAPLLDVKPGMTVIDACAGGGGKSLHIAALMHNQGKLIAMDVNAYKLREMDKRMERAGVTIAGLMLAEEETIVSLKDSADRLLLDVPCSGTGVLRRKPDAKWNLSPEFLAGIRKTQAEILASYTSMVKPGGLVVYSTCSILPSENGKQIQQFLAANPGKFELLEEHSISPVQTGYDGFYMAKLKRLK